MNAYKVIQNWKVVYQNPILLKAGQEVIIDNTKKEENPEWYGWVWCKSVNNEGWVPMQILDIIESGEIYLKGTVNEHYSAREMDVSVDEIVLGDKILNGWLWCKKEGTDEYGWLPLQNVILVTL